VEERDFQTKRGGSRKCVAMRELPVGIRAMIPLGVFYSFLKPLTSYKGSPPTLATHEAAIM